MFNDPVAFKEEMIDGFTAAYGRYLRRVPDASGVVAVNAPVPGRVSLVIGGGAGHYPAFCGLVGDGLATGAVIGDVFTSPSGEQVYRVAKAADGGAGILFSFGNYAGDVMNFGMAEQRLQSEGVDARTVFVTDDVLSAPPEEAEKRRGIAGGFYVFKTGGASAARGDDIDTVEALMRRANARVRTVGVAFDGCTIPGQKEPLFTVVPGNMEVGLGIHGEPGVRSTERLPASEVAKLLVDAILADAPKDVGSQAAVLVNGLGATKYEELFVLYHGVAPLLAKAGIEPYEPLVGEFVTSLNMAGCSLTLFWLDDDLRPLHDATASTPAFTRIGPDVAARGGAEARRRDDERVGAPATRTAIGTEDEHGEASEAGRLVRAGLAAALQAMEAHEEELGRLDAAAGDGDHGAGMVRGFRAATAAVAEFDGTARETLIRAGRAFTDAAGGASGALVGGWLVAMGTTLPRDDDEVDSIAISKALQAGLASMQRIGHAELGDKTMIDTLLPFVHTFEAAVISDPSLPDAWTAALAAGKAGMERTTGMVSKRGRSSRVGERSRGSQDPGATSMYYVLQAFGSLWS
jgi:dihydroxyacetone kinase